MENQDKIFEQFKDVANRAESKEFPAMEKVWSRVEEKLDHKATQKSAGFWKMIAVAASLLLFVTLGYELMRPANNRLIAPKNEIVTTPAPENAIKIEPATSVASIETNIPPTATKTALLQEKQKVYPDPEADDAIPSASFAFQTAHLDFKESGDGDQLKKREKPSAAASEIAPEPAPNYQTITGVVSNPAGLLSGANVVVMGTNRGTRTDADGKYSIEAKKGEQIVFSRGSEELVTTVGSQNQINAELPQSDASNGYLADNYKSTDRKNSKTRSNLGNTFNGVIIRQKTPPAEPAKTEPVTSAKVGFMGNSPTLYIIDGKPSTETEFRQIKADEIQSMKLLTESEATSLYGSKAVNGAMIVSKKAARTAEPGNWGEYEALAENSFESPMTAPLSTFMLNVENNAYIEIRNAVNKGIKVPVSAVRIAEMINYFEYKYPQPQDQNPVSINTEYSSCPWNSKHKLVKIGLQGKNSSGIIAKDVRLQIEFNPMIVKGYRLIGYEKRKPRPEDFKNISDATEIGGGHTVTALYEVIPINVESQYFEEPDGLKYTKINTGTTFGNELATVKFRYKKTDAGKSVEMVKAIPNKPVLLQDSSNDFRFCAAVAWFGLKLRGSEFIGNVSKADLLKLAKGSLTADAEGSRMEFIRLVEAAK